MHHAMPQNHDTVDAPAREPWGPLPGLNPVQEYHALAREL